MITLNVKVALDDQFEQEFRMEVVYSVLSSLVENWLRENTDVRLINGVETVISRKSGGK